MRHRVLCVSASMGAGHDGAARELARRLAADGHEVEIKDFLEAPPLRMGAVLKWTYEFMIRRAPWSYELTYRTWFILPFLCPPLAVLIAWLTGRRIQRWCRELDADVVVSTYPLATVAIGELRRRGKLAVPAVNFITDFGVHPLWVHSSIDLNLTTHPKPARDAAQRTGQPAVATGPMVSPRFFHPHDRDEVRRSLGLQLEDRAVLVVAGSWGVGAIAETFGIIAGSGRYVPIVVCGHDERLRRRLAATGQGRVLGWSDQMPALMAAADALVENAGGLTAMEALACGLPVVSFGAIAGHGRENTLSMESVGISKTAGCADELLSALEAVTTPGPERAQLIAAGHAMFVSDPSAEVVALADAAAVPDTVGELLRQAERQAERQADRHADRPARRHRVPPAWVTRAAAVAASVPLAWTGVNFGVGLAAANGVGVAHPAGRASNVAYLAVHIDVAELDNPAVVSMLARLHATAVVDGRTARLDPAALRKLAARDIIVANGGAGVHSNPRRTTLPWRRAQADVVQSAKLIASISGEPARLYVPMRRINGFDLLACRASHCVPIVPNEIIPAGGDDESGVLHARQLYLVDGYGASVQRLLETLQAFVFQMAAAHLTPAPLVTPEPGRPVVGAR